MIIFKIWYHILAIVKKFLYKILYRKKIEIAKNNGGYGDIPIFVYGYISLKKNETSLKITDDEQLAEAETQEALRYLFYKEITLENLAENLEFVQEYYQELME